jgi:pectate lyase
MRRHTFILVAVLPLACSAQSVDAVSEPSAQSTGAAATGSTGGTLTGGVQPSAGEMVANGGATITGGAATTTGGAVETGGLPASGGAPAGGGASGENGADGADAPIGFAAIPGPGLETTTGGAGGPVATAATFEELDPYMDNEESMIIIVDGVIDLGGMATLRSNKTLIGLDGARLINGGLEMYARQNIIIRNLTFADGTDDTIKINQDSHHIWVDHCDMTDAPDGLFDITRRSSHITISWNHFYNHSKTMLIGHSDATVAGMKTSPRSLR